MKIERFIAFLQKEAREHPDTEILVRTGADLHDLSADFVSSIFSVDRGYFNGKARHGNRFYEMPRGGKREVRALALDGLR